MLWPCLWLKGHGDLMQVKDPPQKKIINEYIPQIPVWNNTIKKHNTYVKNKIKNAEQVMCIARFRKKFKNFKTKKIFWEGLWTLQSWKPILWFLVKKSFTITYIKIRVKVLKLEIQVKMKYLKHFFFNYIIIYSTPF